MDTYSLDWDPRTDALERRQGERAEIVFRETGREWLARVHPEEQSRYREVLRGLTPDRPGYRISYRRALPSGAQVEVEEQGRAWFDPAGAPVRITALGRPAARPAPGGPPQDLDRLLGRERELLAGILDRIPVMVTVYDPSLRELRVNREFERVLGWSGRDLRGRDVMAVCYPDPAYREQVRGFMTPPRHGWADFRVTARDGTEVDSAWANVRLSDDTHVGIGIDIRARKAVEHALRESEERFRLMAETVPDILFTTDAHGCCDYLNPRFFEYTGLPEDTGGLGWMEAVHPDDRERVRSLWRGSEEVSGGSESVCTYRLRSAAGEWRWFQARISPVRDPGGSVTRWFGVVSDIHELQTAREALETANRRKNELLAMLGHELRNPMAPIRSAVDAVAMIGVDDPQVRWALGVIDRQSRRMSRLLDDLLDVSRLMRGRLELRRGPVLVDHFVSDAVEEAGPAVDERGHLLTVDLPQGPLTVDGDPVRLSQILVNLLTNAAKYTPSGGRIALSGTVEGRDLVLRVRDDGQGMSRELLAQIFEAFSQGERALDRAPGGLGLGLTIASRLAEMHGGGLEADSAGLGQGSEFRLRLPLLRTGEAGGEPDAAAPDRARDRPGGAAGAGGGRQSRRGEEHDAAARAHGPRGA